jgi:hypothetical protein
MQLLALFLYVGTGPACAACAMRLMPGLLA